MSCGWVGSGHQLHSLSPDAERMQAPSAPSEAAWPHRTQCLCSAPGLSLLLLGHLPDSYRACLSNVTATHSLRAAPSTTWILGQRRLRPRAQRAGRSRWTETYFRCRDLTSGFRTPIPGPSAQLPPQQPQSVGNHRATGVRRRPGASPGIKVKGERDVGGSVNSRDLSRQSCFLGASSALGGSSFVVRRPHLQDVWAALPLVLGNPEVLAPGAPPRGLTFTRRLLPGPRAVEQAGALGGAAQQVAHLAGEAQQALRLELVAQPRPVGGGPWVSAESRVVSCGADTRGHTGR